MRSRASDKGLGSIAGAPRRIFTGVATSGDVAETGDPLAPRTLYTIFTVNQNHVANAVQNIAAYGATTGDVPANRVLTLRINTNAAGAIYSVQCRNTGGGGPTQQVPGLNSATHGTHVAVWGMNANRDSFVGVDGGTISTSAIGTLDVPNIRVSHFGDTTKYANQRTTLVYDGLHTPSQRSRIEQWLRNNTPYWPNLLSRAQSTLEVINPTQTEATWMNYFGTQELNTSWSETGTASMRVVPAGNIATAVMLGMGQNGTLKGVVPGQTYTLCGTINVESVQQSGYHATRGRRITAFARKADLSYVELFSSQAPNTVGVYRLSAPITIPSDANEFFIRLSNGSPNVGDLVSFDRIGLFEHGPLGAPPADWWTPGVW